MRIVMVSKALVMGAYQRKLEELAKLPDIELIAVAPPVWREAGGAVLLDRAHTSGYRMIVADPALNGQFHLHFYPEMRRLLDELRPDILHMDEEPYNLATWHTLRAAESVGARSLFFTWQNLERRYPWPFARFEQINYQRAAYAIAGNQAAATVLRAKGYAGPVAVIPQFGVDPIIFSPGASRPPQQHTGPWVIGYAGRLAPEKGVALLIRACAALTDTDWQLRIAGDGPQTRKPGRPGANSRCGRPGGIRGAIALYQCDRILSHAGPVCLTLGKSPQLDRTIRSRAH